MGSHPFIITTVITEDFGTVDTTKINTIYMIGTKGTAGSILDNEIKKIEDVANFDIIIGANAASKAAFKFLRLLDPGVPVYFVNGKGSDVTPTLTDNLIAGVTLLGKNIKLEPGIVVCPEIGSLVTGIETVFTAIQNLVSNPLMNWEYYHNLSIACDTKIKALAELNLLSSPQGHSSAFWGWGKDADNNLIPLSVVAAARTTSLNRTRVGYFPPSAYQESIPFSSVDTKYIPLWYIGVDEYTELNDKNLNTIFLDGDGINTGSYTLCGARTLATDSSWRFINTRYAANNIFYRTGEVLKPFLFLPTDALQTSTTVGFQDSIVNSDVILALTVLMQQILAEGAFAIPPTQEDGTQPEPYTIIPNRLPDGNLAITIEIYLIQTREKITRSFVKKG